MKFYPLRNWRRGQRTVLIDGDRYYTLEGATNWNLEEKGEERVTLAAYRGEEWIKEREKTNNPLEIHASQGDKEWVKSLLGKETTHLVSLRSPEAQDTEARWIKARQEREKEQKEKEQKEKEKEQWTKTEWVKSKLEQDETLLVAPTPTGHQDAGTIRVNPEARIQADKNKAVKEKVTAHTNKKGKGRAPKAGRTSPPVTRARKRARQANTTDSCTASQDSCTPRNPLQDNSAPNPLQTEEEDPGTPTPPYNPPRRPFRPSKGYTPPP